MNWDRKNDNLFFDFAEIRKKLIETPTKRAVLQSMTSIYDPLGLISPVLVSFKNLFQEICEEGLGWDAKLPSHLAKKWKNILKEFDEIEKLLIEVVERGSHKYSFTSRRGSLAKKRCFEGRKKKC